MRILLVEDKAEEQEKALSAVLAAGHTLDDFQGERFEALKGMSNGVYNPKLFERWNRVYRYALNGTFGMRPPQEEDKVEGIITDLHFHAAPNPKGSPPAAGLLVVLDAIRAGIPVVVCTNSEEVGGHHAEALSWIFDGYVSTFKKWWEGGAPFGWVEDKDWAKAVSLLERMVSKKAEADRSAS